MIPIGTIEDTLYRAMRLAATRVPPDVEEALLRALDEETDPLAREHLEVSLENMRLAREGAGLVCADTGFPLFYIDVGPGTEIKGGFAAIYAAASRATQRATDEAFLRPTMVNPLTRNSVDRNVGMGMPKVELRFRETGEAGLDIVAAPKGGGSEIFGTFYRMMYPSDGRDGILSFAIDAIQRGCYAGKICPPAIIGVGIGGTADICMRIAKEAAVLRKIGTPNDDLDAAEIEQELTKAARNLGIGPMGARGVTAVLAVHVATAATHTAALPVAVNAQCLVGRRWPARIAGDGAVTIEEGDRP